LSSANVILNSRFLTRKIFLEKESEAEKFLGYCFSIPLFKDDETSSE
jgi:hypothetical protein